MRKDAKIGFAIGGVLLVVLTVYAIVVPKHKKSNTTVSIVNTPSTDTPSTPPLLSGGNSTGNSGSSSSSTTTPPVDPVQPAHTDATVGTTPPAPVTPPDAIGNTPPATTDGVTKPDDVKTEKTAEVTPDHLLTPGGPGPETHTKPTRTHTAQLDVPVAPPATGDRTYVVQSGQTLSSIASEIYGNPRFWVAIQRENKSINPGHLKVGEKINLPDITPIQPGGVEEAADVESPVNVVERPRTVTPPSTPTVSSDAHSYVVKSGDSLYKIARTVLGSGRKADALYALNKDEIGPDKSKLKLGMVLKLPEAASARLASPAPVR
jgi:nucleoid-associated protein YgaU